MTTKLSYKKVFSSTKEIIYSVITPVYNQESIIVENLQSIINNTGDNFEIIIILDFCFDNTEQNIMNFLANYENKVDNFIQITILKNEDKPLFETKCDNIGFKISSGKYCLEIQADMKMVEKEYNLHLTKPFNKIDNVIAVSGRCAHNLFNDNGIGKLGYDIEKSNGETFKKKDLVLTQDEVDDYSDQEVRDSFSIPDYDTDDDKDYKFEKKVNFKTGPSKIGRAHV